MKPPISDPFEAPNTSTPEDERIFRVHFWRYFLMTLAVGFVVALPILLIGGFASPMGARAGVVLSGILGGIVAGLLGSISMVWLTPVKISRHSLKSSNFWGVAREVEWSQIGGAKFLWLGLPYLLISTPQKRNFIWLPLVLSDEKGFARAVEEWAPADNPLRLLLQKREF